MGGTLPNKAIDHKEENKMAPNVTIATEEWKGFEINVFRVLWQMGNLVEFNAQVPLEPEAIQIMVTGDAKNEQDTYAVLRSILRNLEVRQTGQLLDRRSNIF